MIADTGSTDNTIAVARECGATVITCLWTDHYADARNIALAPMTTLVLDADEDEELPDETRHSISRPVTGSDDVAGYLVSFRNYFKERFNGMLGSLSRENTDRHERTRQAASYAEHSNLPSVPP